jgi:hypothetical protein
MFLLEIVHDLGKGEDYIFVFSANYGTKFSELIFLKDIFLGRDTFRYLISFLTFL